MNKKNGAKLCDLIGIILLLAFILKTAMDYSRYTATLNSAPFYVWVLANALYFIIPAMAVFIVGGVLRHRARRT